jgi:hypothetical protein
LGSGLFVIKTFIFSVFIRNLLFYDVLRIPEGILCRIPTYRPVSGVRVLNEWNHFTRSASGQCRILLVRRLSTRRLCDSGKYLTRTE